MKAIVCIAATLVSIPAFAQQYVGGYYIPQHPISAFLESYAAAQQGRTAQYMTEQRQREVDAMRAEERQRMFEQQQRQQRELAERPYVCRDTGANSVTCRYE